MRVLVIPGKYVNDDGEECTVLMLASDGKSGEKTVIYRRGGARVHTLGAELWAKEHHSVEELNLRQQLESGSEAELLHRFVKLFAGRPEVCSVHWRSTFATEGYNYLCENRGKAPGCMFGTDNCKNCRFGRFTTFSESVAEAHLKGEKIIGVYPILDNDGCRFMVIERLGAAQLAALKKVCGDFEIPAYGEKFNSAFRLWCFFAAPVAAGDARSLGCALVTKAMDESDEITFELYENVVPRRGTLAGGSVGKPVVLPLGSHRRERSFFTDDGAAPAAEGPAAIFGFRTITRHYLADRLEALGVYSAGGECCFGLPANTADLEFPKKMQLRLEAGVAIDTRNLPSGTAAALKRMACFKNPEAPLEEFSEPSPALSVCFREDGKRLVLPRGLWGEVEKLLRMSGADFTVSDCRKDGEKCYYRFDGELSGETAAAVRTVLRRPEGMILGPVGSGKTQAVAGIISELKASTLILTADETTRRRWTDNVYRLLGTDAEKAGSKIDVRLITDEKLKDKYGLVVIADCSRVPMNGEIFARLSALSPAAFYGITADDKRRDGMWGYVRMLCGDVVCSLKSKFS